MEGCYCDRKWYMIVSRQEVVYGDLQIGSDMCVQVESWMWKGLKPIRHRMSKTKDPDLYKKSVYIKDNP